MQSTVLAETEAFIARQREELLKQREDLFNQQQALQTQLDEVNAMLRKFDVFEGKASQPRQQARTSRSPRSANGTRRSAVLRVIKEHDGLSRAELLEKMGLKGNKSGEMSVSNALTALTKANQVTRRDRKYVAA
jgi:hypothetical protein